MNDNDYPSIYNCANRLSISSQKIYIYCIIFQYLLLILSSITTQIPDIINKEISVSMLFLLSITVLYTFLKKPEQDWYNSRALSESIKTSTWRYIMRAKPFMDNIYVDIPNREFSNHIHKIIKDNKALAEKMSAYISENNELITEEMKKIRTKSLEERFTYYKDNRIKNQKRWYSKKSLQNKKKHKKWIGICFFSYALLLCVYFFGNLSQIEFISPFFVTLSASIIGWIQIKKFSELSASYLLTSQEIQILLNSKSTFNSEDEFSDYINESELVFSREHTQWVARQQ